MNLCKNCLHFCMEDGVKNPELGKCARSTSISPVTGNPTPPAHMPFCRVERMKGGGCEQEGVFYKEFPNV